MKLFKVLSLVVITATFSNLGALHASSKMEVDEQTQYTPEELYRLCETDPEKIASNEKLQDLVVHNIISHNIHLSDDQILAVIPNLVKRAIDNLLLGRLLVEFTNINLSDNLVSAIKAEAATNDEAAYINATMLWFERGVEEDGQQAHDKFALLAKKDHVAAIRTLGDTYLYGWEKADGTRQAPDPDKALENYKKTADKGDAIAMTYLGIMYGKDSRRGNAPKQDPDDERAVEYYQAAIDKGNAEAMARLGLMCEDGWEKADGQRQKHDPDKALEYYKKAADKGNELAQGLMRNNVHLDSALCLDPAIDFSLSNDGNNYIFNLLGQLFFGKDMFDSIGPILGSKDVPEVADAFGKVIADVEEFQTLLESFNNPGFLVTCLKAKIDGLSNSTPEYPMFKTFTIGEEEYQCFGRENVKAADELLPLIEKMKKIQDHPSVSLLRGYFMGNDLLFEDSGQSDQKARELSDDEFLAQLKNRCARLGVENVPVEFEQALKKHSYLNPESSKESDDNTEEETFFKVLNKMCDKFQEIPEEVYKKISSQAGSRNRRVPDANPWWAKPTA